MPVSGSSPGRLLVIGILSLLVVHISSEAWSNEVSDVQYGRLGSSVTLACRGSRSPVEWRVNGSSVLPRQAVQLDSSLSLPSAHISMEGNYSCHDQSGTLIQAVRLRLGNPPGPVNITCRLPSHFKVFCSWTTSVDSTLPTQYFSSYSSRDNGVLTVETCIQEEQGSSSCVIEHPPMWSHKHLLNITEVNPLGSQQTIIRVDLHQLMKPDPPEAVRSMEVEGHPTRLQVQWRIPESWTPEDISDVAFPLAFQLRYRPVGSKYWSMLFTEDDTSLTIMDALAGHPHHIQVQAKDGISPESQWSDWSQLVQAQPWTEPLIATEEPTAIPEFFSPEQNNTGADTSTVKGPDSQLPDGGGLGVVMLLSLFAGIIGIVAFTVILLLWMRHQKRGGLSKQQLTSMVKMKSLLI
ncbi:interleukin-11 receptor subunit alpha isoform X1 [Alosa sapidissima]|nr:interleukin-11 receptor subunit alpha isoform X1 [Alosa sapidissima]XP_041915085.1 interleukin-11 receptor subunit alpha isoform X1 [Alosa sapidissima]XP_041915086.1 interleukin-11 receptor subunit alpha isoform X1 [Alosa sapidissima]